MSSNSTALWLNGLWVFFCTTAGASVAVWNETLSLGRMRDALLYSTLGDEVWIVGALLIGAFFGYAASICITLLAHRGKQAYVRLFRARPA